MEESIVIPKRPDEPEWLAKDNRTLKMLAGPKSENGHCLVFSISE